MAKLKGQSATVGHFLWDGGSKGEPYLKLCRPCSCGCDMRDKPIGFKGIGYLIGAIGDGTGFTIWLMSEEMYQAVAKVIGERG